MVLSRLLHDLEYLGSHMSVPSLLQMKKQEHQRLGLDKGWSGRQSGCKESPGSPDSTC